MARAGFSLPPEYQPDNYLTDSVSRRSAALAAASALWPSSRDLFNEEFLSETFEDPHDELNDLLAQIEVFSQSAGSGPAELFKFRELLLEVAHAVFLRWKVLHQLRTMALTDELTGLYNRRGFLLLGTHNIRLAQRASQPLILLFADVDGLKGINDRCGHVHGDALLVGCGEVLKMTFRESDVIARIGGDEFAILAQGAAGENHDAVLQRLNQSVDLMNRNVLAPYQLSLSVGAANFDPRSPVGLGELLSIADREMMNQKELRDGRGARHSSLVHNGNGLA